MVSGRGLLAVLLLSTVALGANDFSTDPNCVGLWEWESQNGTDTSYVGTNDVNEYGGYAYLAGKVGSYSIDLEESKSGYCSRDDADLSTGFPGKDSGGSTVVSFCAWFSPEAVGGGNQGVISKWGASDSSFGVYYHDAATDLWRLAYEGSAEQTAAVTPTNPIAKNDWYHIAFTIDASANYRLRVWHDEEATVDEITGQFSNGAMNLSAQPLLIGMHDGGSYADGNIDEVVIFNDVLTQTEIDQIRNGTYTGPPGEYSGYPHPRGLSGGLDSARGGFQ